MATLFLVRHGESIANMQGIYQGQSYDTSLSNLGKSQAQAVSPSLKKLNADKLYASPLKRTQETASIIDDYLQLGIVFSKDIMEINHGTWEGKRVTEFDDENQAILNQWKTRPDLTQMPDGEHFQDVLKRVKHFLGQIKEDTAIVVTHDAILRTMVALASKLAFRYLWNFQVDNCSITQISWRPNALLSLNETAHLEQFRSNIHTQAL